MFFVHKHLLGPEEAVRPSDQNNTRQSDRELRHRPRDPASVNAMKQTCVNAILAYLT